MKIPYKKVYNLIFKQQFSTQEDIHNVLGKQGYTKAGYFVEN